MSNDREIMTVGVCALGAAVAVEVAHHGLGGLVRGARPRDRRGGGEANDGVRGHAQAATRWIVGDDERKALPPPAAGGR